MMIYAGKNSLKHQGLRAWTTVVHHAVVDSVEALMTKLGKDTKYLQRGSKGFLGFWYKLGPLHFLFL